MPTLPSHKYSAVHLEHCKEAMSNARLTYVKGQDGVEKLFAIPLANTNVVTMDPGTSVTHQAVRLRGEDGACLALVASGATSVLQRVLLELTVLAGLLHDLGKINLQFLASLQNAAGPQRLRHETISYLLLEHMRRNYLTDRKPAQQSDRGFFEFALNPDALFKGLVSETGEICLPVSAIGSAVDAAKAQDETNKLLRGCLLSDAMKRQAPLLTHLFWLVLTHHHLIQPDADALKAGQLGDPSSWRHVQDQPADPRNLQTHPDAVPWKLPDWLAAFRRCVGAIHQILLDNPKLEATLKANHLDLDPISFGLLRPALILGDQAASSIQRDVAARNGQSAEYEPGKLYAKSLTAKPLTPGDTLETHLISASKHGRQAFSVLSLARGENGLFPVAALSDLAPTSRLTSPVSPKSRFYWQQAAAERVRSEADIKDAYFFAALLAEPGAGKTLAGPRVLFEAAGGAGRLTFAQGLKSLTLQTGKAFTDPHRMGFDKADVAVLVGDHGARMLFEAREQAAHRAADPAQALPGSECMPTDEDTFHVDTDRLASSTNYAWREAICPLAEVNTVGPNGCRGIASKNLTTLIDSPVVVCTVDHLIPAALMTRNSDVSRVLRVASADLILDELDSYSAEDLVALGRLVHLHGLYGRRVILMSGTLPDTVVASFYEEWLAGIRLHRLLTDSTAPVYGLLVSNLTEPMLVKDADPAAFRTTARAFAETFSERLETRGSKVIAQIAPPLNPDNWAGDIVQLTAGLHANNHTVTPTGHRLSFGFVRFNNVRNAQHLAAHVLHSDTLPEGIEFKVLCYHARFPAITRALLENFMDTALNRCLSPIPDHERVQAALAASPHKDVIFLVCTTSIEETGRDHDFDWQILEPHSARSAIQAAGRLYRHREFDPVHPNCLILQTTIAALEKSKLPYGRSGIQDNPHFKTASEWLRELPTPDSELANALKEADIDFDTAENSAWTLEAKDLLPASFWGRTLTPAAALCKPTRFERNRLGSLEHLALAACLDTPWQDAQTDDTLHALTHPAPNKSLWLDARHAKRWGFRKNSTATLEVCLSAHDLSVFMLIDDETGRPSAVPAKYTKGKRFKHPERAVFDLDNEMDALVAEFCEQYGWKWPVMSPVLGRGKPYLSSTNASPEFEYSPILGFSQRGGG